MLKVDASVRDEVAWQTWQEIANRQFRALLREDEKQRRASALRATPWWKRVLCAIAGIEPKATRGAETSARRGYP